jgi:SAM-dependent methyltransferase
VPDREAEKWRDIYSGGGYPANTVPSSIVLRVIRWHRRFGASGGDALDLGCGQGFDLRFLAENGYRVTGVEYVVKAVKDARARLRAAGQKGMVLAEDLRSLGSDTWRLRDRQFDLVVAVDVLNLLGRDAQRVLEELPQLVTPGGFVGINTPNIDTPAGYDDGSGKRWFSLEQLEDGFPRFELIEKTVTTYGAPAGGGVWGGIILRRPPK